MSKIMNGYYRIYSSGFSVREFTGESNLAPMVSLFNGEATLCFMQHGNRQVAKIDAPFVLNAQALTLLAPSFFIYGKKS